MNENTNLSKNDIEEFIKRYSLLSQKKYENKLYITTEEIEQLINRFAELYRKAAAEKQFSQLQLLKIQEDLLLKYNFEVERLSKFHEAEYKKEIAALEAKNKEQIPWRRCWLWRLIFRPVTNRAQDIIEEAAALEAEQLFTSEEQELEGRADSIYGQEGKELSKRKRKKILKKYLKYKRLLEGEEPSDKTANALERLETALTSAAERGAPFEEPAAVPPATSEEKPNVSEKPPAPRRHKKKTAESNTAPPAPPSQLEGQIKIEEITAKN